MKRTVLAFLGLVLAATVAYATNQVTSVNVVGYTKIEAPGQELVLKAMSFDAFDQTLVGVFGTNQLNKKTAKGGWGAADKIYIWDPSLPGYKIYGQDVDNEFYDVINGGSAVTSEIMTAGTAFWMRSAASQGVTNQVTLMGEVVAAPTQIVDIVEGLQLISYGFSSDLTLQGSEFVNSGANLATVKGGAGAADKVYVWKPGVGFEIYAPDETGTWYNLDEWKVTPADVNIELGNGFWFLRRTGTGTFPWTETNKYLNNL